MSNNQEILCHACLGSGEYVHRNYLNKEVGRAMCEHCKGTGNGLIDNVTGAFVAKKAPEPNPAEKATQEGWQITYCPHTRFLGAKHPNGGRVSLAELKKNTLIDPDELGRALAALLNHPLAALLIPQS